MKPGMKLVVLGLIALSAGIYCGWKSSDVIKVYQEQRAEFVPIDDPTGELDIRRYPQFDYNSPAHKSTRYLIAAVGLNVGAFLLIGFGAITLWSPVPSLRR